MIKTDKKLGRSLGFFPVFAIGTGTMIGAGIFILPGIAASSAGPAAILSFVLGGLIAMATALSMAELATGMPRAGGTYYFISRAMGPIFGNVIGLGAWLALVFKGSFALVGLAEYMHYLIPAPILLMAILSGIALIVINYRGAESSGALQNGIVIGLFIILISFITLGFFNLEGENLTPFVPYGSGSIFVTTGLIFVSYLGITQLAAISEEVKDPSRNLPRAFIASVGVVTILYAGIMFIVNGILPLDNLGSSSTPLIDVAQILGGSIGVIIIIIAGFFATVSTANAAIFSSSRFPFAMGRDRLIPEKFVDIHDDFGTPARSIVITGVVMILFVLFFDVEQLAKLGSTFNVLIFVLINISVVILRRKKQKWYKPSFLDPLYPFTQIFGIVASLSLVPQLGLFPFLFTIVVMIIGILWFAFYGREQALPEYGLLDIIDEDQIPVSIEENKKRIIVSINSPEHEKDLIELANQMGDVIIGLHVQKVPPQTELGAAQRNYKDSQEDRLIVEEFEQDVCTEDCRFIQVFSHDVAETILEQAEHEYADLLIMGWNRNEDHFFGSDIPHKVMSHARSHLAILKGYFPEKLEKILIPYGGGDSSNYAVYLARRLGKATGAEIKLLRIIPPETGPEDRNIIEDELKQKIEEGRSDGDDKNNLTYEIRERFSMIDAVIDASAEADLMIVGDENKRFKLALLGDRAEKIVKYSKCPTLLVKRYRPLSKRGLKSYIKKKKTKKIKNKKPK
ncbi:MAG: amino acid permease [Halanaerobiaceae bacterium]